VPAVPGGDGFEGGEELVLGVSVFVLRDQDFSSSFCTATRKEYIVAKNPVTEVIRDHLVKKIWYLLTP
jgi:hypothetical protein